MKFTLCVLALTTTCGQCFSQTWLPVGEGLRCSILDLIHDITIDTLTGDIYARGQIFYDGDCEVMRTAVHWDGSSWEKMGNSMESVYGMGIGIYQGDLYSTANGPEFGDQSSFHLGKWNGELWNAVPGAPSDVFLIEEHGGYLYIGGVFSAAAEFPTKLLTRYRDGQWEKLISYFDDSPAYGLAMAIYRDTIYIGGNYSADHHFGTGVNDLAKIYNTDLHRVGNGLNGNSIVEAMAVCNDTLFIAGSFSPGNFTTGYRTYVLTYADGKLEPYPVQPDARVTTLKAYGDAIYAGGWFKHVGDSVSNGVVKLKNGRLEVLNREILYGNYDGETAGVDVRDIEIYNDTLYMAGAFYAIGADTALNCIAKLNRELGGPGTVSVKEDLKGGRRLTLFPNPTNETLTVQWEDNLSYAVVRIYDITGKMVYEEPYPRRNASMSINVSSLSPGAYILHLASDERTSMARFVREP